MIALVVVPVVERGPISQRMDAMDVITNKLFHITHIKTQTCTPSRGPIESPRVTCRFGTALWCIPHESCRIHVWNQWNLHESAVLAHPNPEEAQQNAVMGWVVTIHPTNRSLIRCFF